MGYKIWGSFLIVLFTLVVGELIFGCVISISKIPNSSGLVCRDDNLLSFIVNIIFQIFIMLIVSVGIITAHKKSSKNK